MSGIEVIGLVLGAVPLVISALEHYAEGVETIRRAMKYKKELTDLIHDLEAEYLIYQDTTEWLLRNLVTETELQELLKDMEQYPACPRWKDKRLNDSLQERLGRSYKLYLETVEDMNDVMRQFKARLDLSKDGTVRWTEIKGMKQAWKLGRFSLSKQRYDDLVARLQKNNRVLSKLINRSVALEPLRRKGRQSWRMKRIGDYARTVYSALQSSFGCDSEHQHTAILDVSSQATKSDAHHESSPSKIEFHLVISGTVQKPQVGSKTGLLVWQETRIQVQEDAPPVTMNPPSSEDAALSSSLSPSLPITQPSSRSPSPNPFKRRVRFFSSNDAETIHNVKVKASPVQSAQMSVISKTISLPLMTDPLRDSIHISNICKIVTTISSGKGKATDCLGYIVDGNRKCFLFSLARSDSSEDAWSMVRLSQVLRKSLPTAPRLTPFDTLKLAATTAAAVLQLSQSPWLSSAWSNEDIVFLQRDGKRLYKEVFIARSLNHHDPPQTKADSMPIVYNKALLSLGIILVEICLGGPLEEWQTPQDREAGIFADMVTVCRLLESGEIEAWFGPQYQSVVQSCIDLAKGSGASLDEKLQDELYTRVVSVLEEQAMGKSSV